jgi:hypothetical protein
VELLGVFQKAASALQAGSQGFDPQAHLVLLVGVLLFLREEAGE